MSAATAAGLVPLPGDPGVIRSYVGKFQQTSEALTRATQELSALLGEHRSTVSEAVTKLATTGDKVTTYIKEAKIRYSETADALQTFADDLDRAQARAQRAISAYDSAASQLHAATTAHDHAVTTAQNTDPSDPEYADNVRKVRHAQDQLTQLHAAQAQAVLDYEAAVSEKRQAAQVAAQGIHDGAAMSKLNDSLADYVVAGLELGHDWVEQNKELISLIQQVAALVAKWAGYLSGILGLLALLPIPGLDAVFGALALAAGGIALLASLVSLVANLLLVSVGERSWGDVLQSGIQVVASALSVVPGVAALSGAGKAGIEGIEAAMGGIPVDIVTEFTAAAMNSEAAATATAIDKFPELINPNTTLATLGEMAQGIELPYVPPPFQPESYGGLVIGVNTLVTTGNGEPLLGSLGSDISANDFSGAWGDLQSDAASGLHLMAVTVHSVTG